MLMVILEMPLQKYDIQTRGPHIRSTNMNINDLKNTEKQHRPAEMLVEMVLLEMPMITIQIFAVAIAVLYVF